MVFVFSSSSPDIPFLITVYVFSISPVPNVYSVFLFFNYKAFCSSTPHSYLLIYQILFDRNPYTAIFDPVWRYLKIGSSSTDENIWRRYLLLLHVATEVMSAPNHLPSPHLNTPISVAGIGPDKPQITVVWVQKLGTCIVYFDHDIYCRISCKRLLDRKTVSCVSEDHYDCTLMLRT
jgi:hypothetical protein